MTMLADIMDVASSTAEYPYYRIALASACATACLYSFFFNLSSRWSPKFIPGYNKLKATEQVDWNTRLPSTIHACAILALCLQALLFTDQFSSDPARPSPVYRVSATSYTIIGTSFGYFGMDSYLISRYPAIGSKEIYIHHAVALLSLVVCAQVDCMHIYLLLVLLSELTTPLVNLRWMLDKAGLRHLQLYTVNGLLLLLAWGVARVALFVPFYLHVLQHWSEVITIPLHAIVLLIGVPALLFVLNSVWFIKIVKGAYKLVFPPPASRTAAAGAVAAAVGDGTKAGIGQAGDGVHPPQVVRVNAYSGSQMELSPGPHED